MKKIYCILVALCFGYLTNGKSLVKPRLNNWIATLYSTGIYHHYLVRGDGKLLTWQPGQVPVIVKDIEDVVELAAGEKHILALKSDGTVWAWGANDYYQLGNRALTESKNRVSENPVKVNISNVISISASGKTSFALLEDGTVMAWGDGNTGSSGDGGEVSRGGNTAEYSGKKAPEKVKNLENVKAISGAMALLSDGTVWTWGDGRNGRLGNNSSESTSTPVKVQGLSGVIAISSRYDGAIALLSNGTVKAWGYNYKGQLGNGIKTSDLYQDSKYVKSLVPVSVINLSGVKDISADASCLAVLNDGSVKGWGWGNINALGPLGGDATPTPVRVFDLKNVAAVKAGNGSGFALLNDGTLLGWGAHMASTGVYLQSNKVVRIASLGNLAPKPR